MGVNSMGIPGQNKVFFTIYNGKLVIERLQKEELQKVVERLGQDFAEGDIKTRQISKGKNEGKDMYYYVFNDVSGKITNIKIAETDFGEVINVEITDIGENYTISLGDVFGRYSKDFIRRINNLDLEEDVAFGTWSTETDNGKTYSGVRMYQEGNKIEYTEKIEDLPAPTEKRRGKKIEWDFSEQDTFLYKILENYLEDNFRKPTNSVKESKPKDAPKTATKAKKTKKTPEKESDLPWE